MIKEEAATIIMQALLRGQRLAEPISQIHDIDDGQIMVVIQGEQFLLSVEEW